MPSKFAFPSGSVFNSMSPRSCLPFAFTACMITAALRTGFPLSSLMAWKYRNQLGSSSLSLCPPAGPAIGSIASTTPATKIFFMFMRAILSSRALPVILFLSGRTSHANRPPGDRFPALYNAEVKTWDVIIIGGGIIGLSLAIALRKRGATVLVVERGEPGREASHAAGGMLVDCPLETHTALQPLATASARMYPEFAYEIEIESGMKVDLRDQGTILFLSLEDAERDAEFLASHPLPSPLKELEPALANTNWPALYLKKRCVDPRAL